MTETRETVEGIGAQLAERAAQVVDRTPPISWVIDEAFVTDRADEDFDEPTPEGMRYHALETPIGEVPSWVMEADEESEHSSTWVIATHGKGADITETKPFLEVAEAFGFSAIATSYRNHAGAPKVGKGWATFGRDETAEIYAAIEHAISKGAQNIILAGVSHGGAVMSSVYSNAPDHIKALIRGHVQMAPASDIEGIVHDNGEARAVDMINAPIEKILGRGAPESVNIRAAKVGRRLGEWTTRWVARRDNQNWDERRHNHQLNETLDVPMLIMHNTGDPKVPVRHSEVMRGHPLVRLFTPDVEDHVDLLAYTDDPEDSRPYKEAVVSFITDEVLPRLEYPQDDEAQ